MAQSPAGTGAKGKTSSPRPLRRRRGLVQHWRPDPEVQLLDAFIEREKLKQRVNAQRSAQGAC